MKQNLSFGNVLVRYIIGIHFVILAGLLQSLWLVPLTIGLMFTCISGWDPIVALVKGPVTTTSETDVHTIDKDKEDLRAVA